MVWNMVRSRTWYIRSMESMYCEVCNMMCGMDSMGIVVWNVMCGMKYCVWCEYVTVSTKTIHSSQELILGTA